MRHFNIDWRQFATHLDTWATLCPQSQQQLLAMQSNELVATEALTETELAAMVDRGLVAFSADGGRFRIAPGGREFSKAMRAMDRRRFAGDGGMRDLYNYAAEHLTAEEQAGLFSHGHGRSAVGGYYSPYGSRVDPQPAVHEQWVRQWLEIGTIKEAQRWESDRRPGRPVAKAFEDGSPYFGTPGVFDAARRLMATAMNWAQPVPLRALPERVSDVDEAHLWPAVMAAIRYLMLFPQLPPAGVEGHEPVIGLLPQIAYVLHRPEPALPAPIQPAETFHAPLTPEDMTCTLVAASADPLRLLASGGGLYLKDIDRVAGSMIALPPWLMGNPNAQEEWDDDRDDRGDEEEDLEQRFYRSRINDAIDHCQSMKLLKVAKRRGGPMTLQITDAGLAWLGKDIAEQLRTLLDPWREAAKAGDRPAGRARKRAVAYYDDDTGYYREPNDTPPWVPQRVAWQLGKSAHKVAWHAAFADVLMSIPTGRFSPVSELLDYHSRVNNPLLGRRERGTYGPTPKLYRYDAGGDPTDLHWENAWFNMLAEVIETRLLRLGGVAMGFDGRRLLVGLHEIGQYMLGLTETFDYRAQADGAILVQPNFEVVFMGPAPAAEAVIGRLAERTGRRMGALFRLTRRSIFAAAAAGIDADAALADLDRLVAKPLPDNVRREIAGWFNSVARVSMRQTYLIEAPDAPTAARVLAGAGKHARQLTPTVIEVTVGKKNHAALANKLRNAGVFVRS